MNIHDFLSGHNTLQIRVGQSGADVYEIDGEYVLKYGARHSLGDSLFEKYARETQFYRMADKRGYLHKRGYLPKVYKAEVSTQEFMILMKKYHRLERNALSEEVIRKIAKTLALLHTDEIPSFLLQNNEKTKTLTRQEIQDCLSGWKSVLAEHPGLFEKSAVEQIADKINSLIVWHDLEKKVLVHGDCHWDNFLEDNTGNLLLCDWQNVNVGGASGDIGFLASRLGADGIQLDMTYFLDSYVTEVRELTGKHLQKQDIVRHIAAANVITSFVFWHEYLHNSLEKRVCEIYDKMVNDFMSLLL